MLLYEHDKNSIMEWANKINVNNAPNEEIQASELQNVPNKERNILVYMANETRNLTLPRQNNFAKCVLLRLGQWMLDCRKSTPTNENIQAEFIRLTSLMIEGLDEFVSLSKEAGIARNKITGRRKLFTGSIDKLDNRNAIATSRQNIKLVLTSPPYPGVHVLYHRWQVNSRKETAAPFWLAGLKDGHNEAYDTLGGRSTRGQKEYFSKLNILFQSIRDCVSNDALIIQLVAFADMDRHLP